MSIELFSLFSYKRIKIFAPFLAYFHSCVVKFFFFVIALAYWDMKIQYEQITLSVFLVDIHYATPQQTEYLFDRPHMDYKKIM